VRFVNIPDPESYFAGWLADADSIIADLVQAGNSRENGAWLVC
jgi:hypothetical protein